jgi:hypothetical protein
MTSKRLTLTTLCAALSLAGCATAADGPEAMPDLAVPSKLGLVRIGSSSVTSGVDTFEQSMAMALFFDPNQANSVCTRSQTSACSIYRCGALVGLPSAGNITIKGGSEEVVLQPSLDGFYPEYRNTSALVFQRGQTLAISAVGKAVPAWQTSLMMPSTVFVLQSPSPARIDLTWVLRKKQDLALAWAPLASGSSVRVELSQDLGTSQGMLIECSFDGSQGTGTVPSSVLSQLQTTQGVNHAVGILIGPGTETKLSPLGWDVSVVSIGVGRTGVATISE